MSERAGVTDSRRHISANVAETTRNALPEIAARIRAIAETSGVDSENTRNAPCVVCNDVRLAAYGPYRQHRRGAWRGVCWGCRAAIERSARLACLALQNVRTCAACGETFTGARSDARTCASACRQRAYRARQAGAMDSPERRADAIRGDTVAEARVIEWSREISLAPIGTRNDTLNRCWYRAGQVADVLDKGEVRQTFLDAARAAGFDMTATEKVLR